MGKKKRDRRKIGLKHAPYSDFPGKLSGGVCGFERVKLEKDDNTKGRITW